MTNPLQRIGQAIGQFIRRLGPPPQPVYRERVGKPPEQAPTGPINRPSPAEQRREFYRVGFNPKQKGRVSASGERFLTGTYPTKAGVEGALRYVDTSRVEVRVYGEPDWEILGSVHRRRRIAWAMSTSHFLHQRQTWRQH